MDGTWRCNRRRLLSEGILLRRGHRGSQASRPSHQFVTRLGGGTLSTNSRSNPRVLGSSRGRGSQGRCGIRDAGLQEKFGDERVSIPAYRGSIIGRAVGMAARVVMPVPEIPTFASTPDPAAEQLNDCGTACDWRTANRMVRNRWLLRGRSAVLAKWISGTGMRPAAAMPTARPMIPFLG